METRLHHFSYNIKQEKLELVLELFEIFGWTISYRKGDERWCLIEQKDSPIYIEIIEVSTINKISLASKINTHIAFLSDSPINDIEKVEKWSKSKNIKFKRGSWSDKELWFDLPEIFTNFVIEIMHKSIIE